METRLEGIDVTELAAVDNGTPVPDTEPANYYFLTVDAATGVIKVLDKTFIESEGSN